MIFITPNNWLPVFPDGSEIKIEKQYQKFLRISDKENWTRRICGDFRRTNIASYSNWDSTNDLSSEEVQRWKKWKKKKRKYENIGVELLGVFFVKEAEFDNLFKNNQVSLDIFVLHYLRAAN